MALIDLLNEQKRQSEKDALKDTLKGAVTFAGLAGAGIYTYNQMDAVSGVQKINSKLSGNNPINELAKTGRSIRSRADEVRSIIEESKINVLKDFKEKVLGSAELDEILQANKGATETKAFLESLFDSINTDGLATDEEIKNLIRRNYSDVENITDADRTTLKEFYENRINNGGQEKLEKFRSSYLRNRSTANLFEVAVNSGEYTMNRVTRESFNINSLHSVKLGRNLSGSQQNSAVQKITKKYNEIKSLYNGKNYQVNLVGYDEFGDGHKSLYARIGFNNGQRYLNIPLHLISDKNGMAVVRATENQSTRYVAPMSVLNVPKLFSSGGSTNIPLKPGETVNDAIRRNTSNFADHMYDVFFRGSPETLRNIGKNEINEYNSYMRSLSIDAPRGMFSNIAGGAIEGDLNRILGTSRLMQSNITKLVGLEHLPKKQAQELYKNLIRFAPDMYGGVIGAQTALTRLEDPFGGGERIVGSIEALKNPFTGEQTVTPFNILKQYNALNRAVQPLVAREQQMAGRYELAAGFKGAIGEKFGRGGKLSMYSMGDRGAGLIGVDRDIGRNIGGVNIGAIMMFEKTNVANKLGLAEGVSYMGGSPIVKSNISKTAVDESLGQSRLVNLLLKKRKAGQTLKIGNLASDDMSIDDFFKQFGDKQGMAVIGKQDGRTTGIRKFSGLERLNLTISEYSEETGRKRLHITGQMDVNTKDSKFFSSLIKDTTAQISEKQMRRKLIDMGMGDIADEYFSDVGFGGKISNTMMGTTATLSKSSHYLRTQIEGGLKMLGVSNDTFDSIVSRYGNNSDLLKEINQISGKSYTNINQASARQLEQAIFGRFIQASGEIASREKAISEKQFGMVMSYARHLSEDGTAKFGMNLNYFEEKMKAGLKAGDASLSDSQINNYLNQIESFSKRGVVIGAAYATTGTPHIELGRNIAKIEPRTPNYLYSSLRSFFKLSQEEASSYITSLAIRQEGFEQRVGSFLGMKLTQASLNKTDEELLKQQIDALDTKRLTKDEVSELIQMGQGREKDVVAKLSESKGGNILNIEDLNLSNKALNQLKAELGEKTEIFLPGEDTLKGLIGHEIRSTQETLKIEAEYNRYITDLLSSFSSLESAKEDPKLINAGIKGFLQTRSNLSKVVGTTLRESLAGRVLGSGSYMGSGFSLGKTEAEGFSFAEEAKINAKTRNVMLEVFNQEKGYVAFQDAQGFLDGMTTFKKALNQELIKKGIDADARQLEVNKQMSATLKDFFLGMHRATKTGVSAMIQRNPVVSFAHFMPGMAVYRYDFAKETDAFFGLLRSGEERLNIEGKAYYSQMREKLVGYSKSEVDAAFTKLNDESTFGYKNIRNQFQENLNKINEELGVERTQDPTTKKFSTKYTGSTSGVDINVKKYRDMLDSRRSEREAIYTQLSEKKANLASLVKDRDAFNLAEEKYLRGQPFVNRSAQEDIFLRTVREEADRAMNNRPVAVKHMLDELETMEDNLKDPKLAKDKKETLRKEIERSKKNIAKQERMIAKETASGRSIISYKNVRTAFEKEVLNRQREHFDVLRNRATRVQKRPSESMVDEAFENIKKIIYMHTKDETQQKDLIRRAKRFKTTSGTVSSIQELNKLEKEIYDLTTSDEGRKIYKGKFRGLKKKYTIGGVVGVLFNNRAVAGASELQKSRRGEINRIVSERNDLFKMLDDMLDADMKQGKARELELKKQKDTLFALMKQIDDSVQPELDIRQAQYNANEAVKSKGGGVAGMEAALDEKDISLRASLKRPSVLYQSGTKALSILEQGFGRSIQGFEDLELVEREIISGKTKVDVGGETFDTEEQLNKVFRALMRRHMERGSVGGGLLRFPEIRMSADLVDQAGNKVSGYSGRMDFTRFAIGDYDADIYQVFFDTDKSLRQNIMQGKTDVKELYKYGAEFLISMEEMGRGMLHLGGRMGAENLSLLDKTIDDATKERIVKNVGGLDVQIKTGMLGLAQAAADDMSGDFGEQFKRMKAGAALIGVAQEVLAIKAKKLPIAADISEQFVSALRESYKTGSGERIKEFFREKVLKGTALQEGRQISMQNIDILNIEEGEATRSLKSHLQTLNMNVDQMFETFDIMARSVRDRGLANLGSNTRLGMAMNKGKVFDVNQLFRLLSTGMSMEGGVIGGEEVEAAFGVGKTSSSEIARSFVPKKGVAGLVMGGLIASYGLGATQNIGNLEGSPKFSDSRAREALSNRNVNANMNREHSNVGRDRLVGGPQNFYERPINENRTVVSSSHSTRLYGEVASLDQAQTISRHMIASGGNASLLISDHRRPIGHAYINKLTRD